MPSGVERDRIRSGYDAGMAGEPQAADAPLPEPPEAPQRAVGGPEGPENVDRRLRPVTPPTTISRRLVDQIMLDLASGAPLDAVAGRTGASRSAVYKWKARGEELAALAEAEEIDPEELSSRDRLCLELALSIEDARSSVIVSAVAAIRSAFRRDWRSAAWYMERTDPENWGRPYRQRTGEQVEAEEDEPPEEQKRAIVEAAQSFVERRAKREAEKKARGETGTDG